MKLLKILRIILLIITSVIFQLFVLKRLYSPLLVLSVIHLFLLIFEIYSHLIHLKRTRIVTVISFVDIALSVTYLLYINPLFISIFLIIQAMSLVYNDRKNSKISIPVLIILSIIIMCTRYIINRDFGSIILLLPSFLAVSFFFKLFFNIVNSHLEENSYLKSLVDNKNKLLSTLTHELRTPLTVIKTSNELILEERPGKINEVQKSLLTSSLENTIRLISLVENILSQVKVEFSWFTMKKQVLDIRTIVRKVTIDMKPFLDAKNIKLHYNYPGLLSKTLGDSRWIQQVILNLIHNGSKNSTEGTGMEITVKENEQCIVVSVHDTGVGINNSDIPQVFNEFYQSGDPAKDLNDGAGLGLTIVKNIIEKHGGDVYISSIPGSGTTVSFTLPIYKGVFSETFSTGN